MSSLQSFLEDRLNRVRPSGDGFILAACPVHKNGQEKNPSFSVNLKSGGYHCFACGIKGDFEKLKGMLGGSALTIAIEAERTAAEEANEDLNESVLALFNMCPIDLVEAGFDERVLKEHEVGYDTLYGRTTYPIRDRNGKLVAISGRAADGIEPRYQVYTHRMLRGAADEHYKPHNKNYLYGAHTVLRNNPKGAKALVVVEGYKACLWLRQNGIADCVATMGTQVTATPITDRQLAIKQVDELQRICDRAILMFDNDDSGIQSQEKVQFSLLKRGIPTTAIIYDVKQPDSLNQEQIQAIFKPYNLTRYISHGQPIHQN